MSPKAKPKIKRTNLSPLQKLLAKLSNIDKLLADPSHTLNSSLDGIQYLFQQKQLAKRKLLLFRKPS